MKILFIETNYTENFYLNQRNTYDNVNCVHLFRRNGRISRLLRKTFLKLNLPLNIFLGSWSKEVDKYDYVILPVTIYSKSIMSLYNKYESKFRHWYWNSIFTTVKPNEIGTLNKYIYTFDMKDSIDYKINYINTYYFSGIQLKSEQQKYDICFVGSDKGRLDYLIDLQTKFENMGLSTYFHIVKSDNSRSDYKYRKHISYLDTLRIINKSKIILDIVQTGQIGMTQRPLEALFFNKKMITNSLSVRDFDFFHEDNIFIINDNNYNEIKKFVDTDMKEVNQDIKDKYDFKYWIEKIIGND